MEKLAHPGQDLIHLIGGGQVRMACKRKPDGTGDLSGGPLGIVMHLVFRSRIDEAGHAPLPKVLGVCSPIANPRRAPQENPMKWARSMAREFSTATASSTRTLRAEAPASCGLSLRPWLWAPRLPLCGPEGSLPLDRPELHRSSLTIADTSVGLVATLIPAASSASFLAAAVPWEPETIAPACPMRLPGGAVNPAM